YSRAEDLLLESRAIRERVLGKEHPSYAISLNNLALLYESMTEYALAEPLCLEAKEIRERVLGKEHPDYATNINNLASIYKSMGDNARAESLYLEANAIDEKVLGKEHPYYATSLSNLALHYESMGDTARAESLLLESKAIREKVLGKSHPDYAMSLNNLATLYSLSNRTNLAIPLYENSLSLWRTHLTATAAVLSERQQLAMNQSLRGYLDSYITACLRMNPTPPDAVSKIMLWKGSVLHRQRQMRKAAEDSAIAGQFARLQVAVRRLSQLAQAPPASEKLENWKQQIRELTAEKETLESELSRESAVFRDAMQEISFEQIQQAIPADGVLVDYLEYTGKKGRSLLASIVRPNAAPVMINLGSANEASEAIDAWRDTFGMSLQGKAAGLQLRKQIWEPLLEHIGDARTVLVSTDGVLGRLPLAALPGKEPGTYLLEDHRLALIPVSQLLPAMVNELGKQQLQREITRTGEAGKSLLLVGDVDYGTASTPQTQGTVTWGALGQTGAEVDYIGGLYQRLYSPRADAVVDLQFGCHRNSFSQ
ncbi:MAG: tetratricopeptide repeat protein, partial [Pirellulaceae bacterium]